VASDVDLAAHGPLASIGEDSFEPPFEAARCNHRSRWTVTKDPSHGGDPGATSLRELPERRVQRRQHRRALGDHVVDDPLEPVGAHDGAEVDERPRQRRARDASNDGPVMREHERWAVAQGEARRRVPVPGPQHDVGRHEAG
jgi:hypothetical protein